MILTRIILQRMALVLAAAAMLCGCGVVGRGHQTSFELHSLRFPAAVADDATVDLSAYAPLVGQFSLAPILTAEGMQAGMQAGEMGVQIVIHYGRFYLAGDGFHSLWELTPIPGTDQASYRPIRVLEDNDSPGLRDVKLSRFRNLDSVCIRLDQSDHSPLFLSADGAFNATCE